MKKKGKHAFWAAFGLSFTALSLAALSMVFLLNPSYELFTGAPVTEYQPDEADALTVLFVGGEKDKMPEICLLVRMDPMKGNIWLSSLLPSLALEDGNGWNTLGMICEKKGARKAADALNKTFGIPVDRYVRMNSESFSKAADTAGSVEYVLPFSISLTGGIQVQSGRQQMDGRKLTAVIQHKEYADGDLQRERILNDLAATAINQRISIASGAVGEALFKLAVNLSDTDLRYADYQKARNALYYLSNLSKDPAKAVLVTGNYSLARERFLLTAQSATDFKKAFGGAEPAVTTARNSLSLQKNNA